MRLLRYLACAGTVVLFSSCTSHQSQIVPSSAGPRPSLSRAGSVYVAVPENGRFEGAVYPVSGRYTAEALRRAFSDFAGRVYVARESASLEENLAKAREKGCAQLILPKILHWEERSTEWSGKPDRIEIGVQVIECASGKILDDVRLLGKSRTISGGAEQPQDLLKKPVMDYVGSLYGASAAG